MKIRQELNTSGFELYFQFMRYDLVVIFHKTVVCEFISRTGIILDIRQETLVRIVVEKKKT